MEGVDQSFWYSVSSENIKEGRHVGLDFYDLLIEALNIHRWDEGRSPITDGVKLPMINAL